MVMVQRGNEDMKGLPASLPSNQFLCSAPARDRQKGSPLHY